MTPRRLPTWLLAVALVIILAAAALAPIRSYDLFWHLAAGRWIADHLALPLTDPFAIASDRTPWIDGEWLFQLGAYGLEEIRGLDAVAVARALVVGAIFVLAWHFTNTTTGALLASLAFLGGHQQLNARPSTVAALLLVLAIAFVERPIVFLLITVVWINVHPSALLAPLIPLVLTRDLRTTAGAVLALLVNPYGWRAIAAPIELTSFVREGGFVNAEWLPSPPAVFPLLYITIAIAIALFAMAEDRRAQLWRFLLLAIFAALAVRHVRNQGLWYAASPMLAAPFARPTLSRAWQWVAALPVLWVAIVTPHRPAVAPHRFPFAAAAPLRSLRGNVYNPDQFGGFLIWSVYPERRILTDGRNELYHRFLPQYDRARRDSRAWTALLREYRIDLAVDEYRPPLDVIDARTGQHRSMPASLAYWPRRDWALIEYDDVSMVFARRAAFPRGLVEGLELKGKVPDGGD